MPNTQEHEELIKSNKSMAAQCIDLTKENDDLKKQLRDREAELIATIDIINQVMSAADKEINKQFKSVHKTIAKISELAGEDLTASIQRQIDAVNVKEMPAEEKKRLSDLYRKSEKLSPLVLSSEGAEEPKKEDSKSKA